MAMKEALRSSIELRDFNSATRLVNDFETIGLTPDLEPTINVLLGRLYEGLGRNEDVFRVIAARQFPMTDALRRKGTAPNALASATGGLGRKDVINDLETLTLTGPAVRPRPEQKVLKCWLISTPGGEPLSRCVPCHEKRRCLRIPTLT